MSPDVLSLVILGCVVIIMLLDKVPITTLALTGAIVCCLTGLYEFSKIFSLLGNSLVVLLFGLFIIGSAMFHTGLARIISLTILRFTGKSERGIVLGILLAGLVLSTICSNVAVVVMLIPIVKSISKEADLSLARTMYPLIMGSAFGGACTLIGTTSNIAGNVVLGDFNLPLMGFFDIAWVGLPMAVAGILWVTTIGMKLEPANTGYDGDLDEVINQGESVGKLKLIITSVIVAAAVVGMAISSTLIFVFSIVGAVLLILTGCISEKDAFKSLDWSMVILLSSFSVIASSVSDSGGGTLIANFVMHILGGVQSPYIICLILFAVVALITNFLSNQVTVMLMGPIAYYISQGLGLNPVSLIMIVVLAANACFATPVGAPPFTIVMPIAKYKFKDYIRMGLPLVLLNLVIAVIIIPLIWPLR